jgi:hypothetical protein
MFNLFHFFGLLFTSCRLAGDYVDLRYFYHLTHPDGWGWCLFIFVFVVRLVIFLASIAVLIRERGRAGGFCVASERGGETVLGILGWHLRGWELGPLDCICCKSHDV